MRAPSREAVISAFVLVVVLLFFGWTAKGMQDPLDFGSDYQDPHNLQSDALLSGRTSLELKPSPGLLALPDPYNPEANAKYRFPSDGGPIVHDLSLYKDRYYMYWGPTPAVTAFIPFRVLGLGDMPQSLAVLLYAFVGLLFAVGVLRFLVRRYLPTTPPWMRIAGVIALSLSSVLAFNLRRPSQYEVAITAGYCFFFAGLYLLLTGLLGERRSLWRVAAGSLCLGAAAGARTTYGLAGMVALALVVALLLLRERRGELATPARCDAGPSWRSSSSRLTRQLAVALAIPFTICGVLLLAYNYVRFDSLTEFGLSYQLAGIEVAAKETFNFSYIPPGLWYYLIAPVRLALQFPFLFLPPPPEYPLHLPSSYETVEPTSGLLIAAPIILAVLALPFMARHRERGRELRRVIWALAGLGLLLALLTSFSLWATTERYETDFASLLVLAGLLSWFAWVQEAGNRHLRRAIAIVGALLVSWGAFVGVAISMVGYASVPVLTTPNGALQTFRTMEGATAPLPLLASKLAGHPFLTSVRTGEVFHGDPAINYATFSGGRPSFVVGAEPVAVRIASNRNQTVELTGTISRPPGPPHATVYLVARSSRGVVERVIPPGPAQKQRLPIGIDEGLKEVTLSVGVRSRSGRRLAQSSDTLTVDQLNLDYRR